MMQKMLLGQANGQLETAKKLVELNQRLDCSYNDLNIKFESLNSKVKFMERNIASTSAPKPNQLPSKAVQNPREFTAKAIQFYKEIDTEDSEVQAREDLSQGKSQSESFTQKTETGVPLDRTLDLTHDPVHDRVTYRADPEEAVKPVRYIPPAYKPPLPFPGCFKEQKLKELREIIEKKELMALKEEKAQNQDKKDLEEFEGAIIPTKLEDPGPFDLPCSFSYLHFNKYLCDLGASINVMPYSIAQKLGHTDFKPGNLYLCLADGSHKDVVGKLENFLVKIGKARIPSDFLIIDMDKELEDSIILGRPFLATAGAVIDAKKGLITLNIAESLIMKFDINNPTNLPSIGQPFALKDKRDHGVSSEVETSRTKFSSHEKSDENLKGSVQDLTSLVKDLQLQINKRSLKKARPRFKLKQKHGSSLKGEVIKN
ncbi:PREDICTED: uncharacterized protein LOC104709775 [Camelina sativa]|uniref:Uncharacterized protein LOC104709775 n=1 Tax=Camelina sativa TaxID=90675 RepID=A0ABM0TDA8_CAMSA|nr:PREDICTED: uncharacterized protein LOC104709775 [Camelina sativa]